MNTLTEENIEFIYKDVQVKGITMEDLLEEMVDHICCLIEIEIDKGISFDTAYNNLMNSIDSSIFKNVQHQSLLSTNLKFQNMKKSMVILGTLCALLLSAGSILKTFHLPLSGIMMFSGTLITVFGFLPLFFYTSYKEQFEKKNILLSITAYLTLSFLILSVLFKVMHWPGAAIPLLIGRFLLVLLFLPLYLVTIFKKSGETKTKFLFVILIVFIGIGVIFMSSTLRISKDIVEKYDNINNNALKISETFSQQNDSLIKLLEKKESYNQIKFKIDKIQELSFGVDKQIEVIKDEINSITNADVNLPENIRFKYNGKAFNPS